jgi:uncharacterized membrane protein HdeD (DUF308 family)
MANRPGVFEPTATGPTTGTEAMSRVLAQNWWVVALRGIFGVLFGVIAFLYPGATILSLVLVYAAYMLVDGCLAIASAVRAARRNERWGLLVLEGLVDIVAGVLAFAWPGITVLVFVTLVAAWSIVSGALMLAAAFRLRPQYGRWWLALGGLVSIIFGILLILAPLAGAVVLTWWLGAYALVFGIALLVLAFQLRARRNEDARGTVLQGA